MSTKATAKLWSESILKTHSAMLSTFSTVISSETTRAAKLTMLFSPIGKRCQIVCNTKIICTVEQPSTQTHAYKTRDCQSVLADPFYKKGTKKYLPANDVPQNQSQIIGDAGGFKPVIVENHLGNAKAKKQRGNDCQPDPAHRFANVHWL